MQHIWVEMGADSSRAHGPVLRLRLLAEAHPLVRQAMAQDGGAPAEDIEIGGRTAAGPEPSRPPELLSSDVSAALARKGAPPGFEKRIARVVEDKKADATASQSAAADAVSSRLASLSLEADPTVAGIFYGVTPPSYKTSDSLTVNGGRRGLGASSAERQLVEVAVRHLREKAARYALRAAACDPTDPRASEWAGKAEECRLGSQKLLDYLTTDNI